MEMSYTEQPMPELEVTQLTGEVTEQPEIGQVIGPMFARLVTAGAQQGVDVEPGVAWYDMGDEGIRFGACAPATVELDGAERATLPEAPRAVVTTYTGPIDRIGEGWQALGAHLAELGLQPDGVCREVYRTTPADPLGGTWVIELQQPVR